MTALVTGASGGLGRAIAAALAATGHDVAVHYRSNPEGARATGALVADAGRTAFLIGADLATDLATDGDPAGAAELDARAAALLDATTQALGRPDVVVLNAFPQDLTPWAELDTAAWDRLWSGGLRATAALLRAATAAMEPGGVVVTIGSIEGLRPAPGHTAYAVTKAALHHLTAAAAHELGPRGIRVVGVAPGLIDRPGLAQDWPDGYARWSAAVGLGRPVTAEEVAAAVAFVASRDASGLTGITIPVDAGWSAAPGW